MNYNPFLETAEIALRFTEPLSIAERTAIIRELAALRLQLQRVKWYAMWVTEHPSSVEDYLKFCLEIME